MQLDFKDSYLFKKLLPQVEFIAIDTLNISLKRFTGEDAIALTNRICEDREEDAPQFNIQLTDVEALGETDDWSDVNGAIESMIQKYMKEQEDSGAIYQPPHFDVIKNTYSNDRIGQFDKHVRLVSHAMSGQTMKLNKWGDFEYGEPDVYGETEYLHVKWIADDSEDTLIEFDLDGENNAFAYQEIIKAAETAEYDREQFVVELKKLDLLEV